MAIALALAGSGGCSNMSQHARSEEAGTYRVSRARAPMTLDANWNKPAWEKIAPIELTHFMGERPAHFPRTRAKLAYDEQSIYVIFHVDDRYVRAVAASHQDSVCFDSCVEFFFTPTNDIADGYFNLEMNCGGTMLFNFQLVPWKDVVLVGDSDIQRIEVAHTLQKIVEPEITEPTTWTVEYRIPADMLARYCPSAKKPAPGVVWRANLFKCADKTSHPHWLTWALVKNPVPNFHMPQYLGSLIFE
jgi:hypothetical protein